MAWPDGRYIQASIFFSRWLLAPFLLGLLLCLFLLMYRFFADFVTLAIQVPRLTWHDLVTGVLNLVDLALTANLILIVIFSGYENFIRRIDPDAHPDWPEGLTQVDFSELKQKLLGSVIGMVFRPRTRTRHVKARLGAGLPHRLRDRHADDGAGRLAQRPPQDKAGLSVAPRFPTLPTGPVKVC